MCHSSPWKLLQGLFREESLVPILNSMVPGLKWVQKLRSISNGLSREQMWMRLTWENGVFHRAPAASWAQRMQGFKTRELGSHSQYGTIQNSELGKARTPFRPFPSPLKRESLLYLLIFKGPVSTWQKIIGKCFEQSRTIQSTVIEGCENINPSYHFYVSVFASLSLQTRVRKSNGYFVSKWKFPFPNLTAEPIQEHFHVLFFY